MKRWRLPAASALAAVVVTVSFPWPHTRICRNDVAAAATLESIRSAEAEFQRVKRIDLDHDGVGEFGFLAELSGVAALPQGDRAIDVPYLSTAFRCLRPDGTVSRSGYRFRLFLPDAAGNGVPEAGEPPASPRPPDGPSWPHRSRVDGRPVDPALAARRWCAYAWPADHGNTGNVTLFLDQDGNVLCADDPRYSGDRGPEPGAAYAGGGLASITGEARAGAVAQDGNVWRPFDAR